MYRILSLTMLICIISTPVFAESTIKSFEDNFTYVLTDNDTKNDARKFCFLKAKNKVVKAVKVYLKETLEMDDNQQILEEDVDMYTQVLLHVDTKSEKWNFSDKEIFLFISVKTDVDVQYFKKRLFSIKLDNDLRNKIIKEQNALKKREQEYITLHDQLARVNSNAAFPLRKERQAISTEIDKLEKAKYLISSKTKSVSDRILPGMTIDEVVDIAGQPRATSTCNKPDFLNYGNIWVWVNNGIVMGKVPLEEWSGPCQRYGAQDRGNNMLSQQGSPSEEPVTEDKAQYVIILDNGQRIPTSVYYQVGDVIYYKRYGGIIGVEDDKVKEIIAVE